MVSIDDIRLDISWSGLFKRPFELPQGPEQERGLMSRGWSIQKSATRDSFVTILLSQMINKTEPYQYLVSLGRYAERFY